MSRSLLFSPIHHQTEAFSLCSSNFISINRVCVSHKIGAVAQRVGRVLASCRRFRHTRHHRNQQVEVVVPCTLSQEVPSSVG